VSAWHEFTTAALLGPGKGAAPALPEAVQEALGDTSALDETTRFLTQAGALALWRRAGWKPGRNETPLRLSEPETTKPLSRPSAGHLRMMLSGRCAAFLPEWLEEAARLGRHLPPEDLPALLDRARQDRDLRPLVIAAGGRRAAWLAGLNRDWSFAPSDAPDAWETGSRDQRVAWLRALRAAAPAEARAKIEEVWKAEPAETRAAFLAELEAHLSPEDTPFLDALLDDRSKEVRRIAIDLLARQADSPFVARMLGRAAPLLTLKKGGLLKRAVVEVTLPAELDAAAARDGLDPKAFGQQKVLGEKAVLLVLIISAVPLGHWTETFQQSPSELLKATEKDEFARALATGWAWAARRQRDAAWAEALMDGPKKPHTEFLSGPALLTLLPLPARAARLSERLRAGAMKKPGATEWHDSLSELIVLGDQAPAPLVREALALLRENVREGLPWHYRSPIESWLLRLPRALLAEAGTGWPTDQDGVPALVELLTFRHDALAALTQT
jgi:hypothetical protein